MIDPVISAVHIVDDEEPVRDALTFLFQSHGLSSRSYDSGQAFLNAAQNNIASVRGCVVLDVRMEPMSGLQLQDELRSRAIDLPIIFLSGHGDIPMAVEAMHKGAFDFVEKPFNDATLVHKVQKALDVEQKQYLETTVRTQMEARLASLTDRERDVMQLIAAGKMNKVIAGELNISMRTVEVHRSRVLAKFGVRSAAELASLLERWRNKR